MVGGYSFFRNDSEVENKEQIIECEQCRDGEIAAKAEWKCLDCRFPLCGKCKKHHLQIPMLKGKCYLDYFNKDLHLCKFDHILFVDFLVDQSINSFLMNFTCFLL